MTLAEQIEAIAESAMFSSCPCGREYRRLREIAEKVRALETDEEQAPYIAGPEADNPEDMNGDRQAAS